MIGIGIIGYGYWGPNLVRNFAEVQDASVAMVCDLRPERLALAKGRFPSIRTTTDVNVLINDPLVQAVAISTPVSTHFDLAMAALRAGKHVLVEKPISETSLQASLLIKEAEGRGLVLMVDHTFVYTAAVRKIRELIEKKELGRLYYYDSVRVNLGLFQHDVNVLWDLAVHDISIMDYVLGREALAVSATGMSHVEGKPENIAFLTVYFNDSLIAHMHVNWLAPVKIRRTLIGGDRKMIVYDDLEPSEKIKVYDKGISVRLDEDSVYKLMVGYRSGDMWAPQLDVTEALRTELAHFTDCIQRKCRPLTDGQAGLRVIQILEAATKSMKNRGQPVDLNS